MDRYIVPVLGLVLPIGNGLAGAFRSYVEQRVTSLYAELSAVEASSEPLPTGEARADLVRRLDALERQASRLRIPLQFSPLRYTLMDHIRLVRARSKTDHAARAAQAIAGSDPASGRLERVVQLPAVASERLSVMTHQAAMTACTRTTGQRPMPDSPRLMSACTRTVKTPAL